MRSTLLAFWVGVGVAFVIFIITAAATTFEASVTGGEQAIEFVQYVDQGALGRLLAPAALTFGTVRLTKRGWGIVTTYTEELTIAPGAVSARAGEPVNLRVRLSVPGRVIAANATGRDGAALVWSALPANEPLRAQTRAVNWPLLVLLGAAGAASFWLRGA